MKATSWRTGNFRIKSKTLARSLMQLVIAKEVKTNNTKLLSHMKKKKSKLSMKWGKKKGSNANIDFFFSQFLDQGD